MGNVARDTTHRAKVLCKVTRGESTAEKQSRESKSADAMRVIVSFDAIAQITNQYSII